MPASPEALFAWHARAGAFERLTPPWERVERSGAARKLEDGTKTTFFVRIGPLRVRWIAAHSAIVNGTSTDSASFRDVQTRGPFAAWRHDHRMLPAADGTSILQDDIRFAPPFGALGRLVAGGAIRRRLARSFRYRHDTTRADLAAHAAHGNAPALTVAVTGASGLVGRAFVPFLTTGGHRVLRLVRRGAQTPDEVSWDPASGQIDTGRLEGVDAVVHLAGEGIATGRWTTAKKARIRSSRVDGTALLARTLASLDRPPRVFVSASAIGIYGDRGDATLNEASEPADDYLAEVCAAWEGAAAPAREAGIRVVHPRFGVILSPAGGALAKMLPPFRAGVGGRLGSGRQYMSWIGIDDAIGALLHVMRTAELAGPVNLTSPRPLTNAALTRTLGKVLRRPTALPLPAFVARLAFGEMADALLLASARVQPARLLETGYAFRHPELEPALRHLLGREPEEQAGHGRRVS